MNFVHLEFDGAIATITLDHPGGNRINFQMREEISQRGVGLAFGRRIAGSSRGGQFRADHGRESPFYFAGWTS